MEHTHKRKRKVEKPTPEPVSVEPFQELFLMKAMPDFGKSGPSGVGRTPVRSPGTSLVITPTVAWRRLCARTGCGICLETFYSWVREGRIGSIRMGKKIYIRVEALDALVKRCLDGEVW